MIPPAGALAFKTTLWDDIRAAQQGRPTALNDLLGRYRNPVLRFLKMRGFGADDAEDIAQEVLLALTRSSLLQQASSARGRFRNLILAVTRNLASKQLRRQRAVKRGGTAPRTSLESLAAHKGLNPSELVASKQSDPQFDEAWMMHLFETAFEQLRADQPEAHAALLLHLRDGLTYGAIAKRTGSSWNRVNYQIRMARQKTADLMRAEILRYSSSAEEFKSEMLQFEGLFRTPVGLT